MRIRNIFKGISLIFIVYCLISYSEDIKSSVLSAMELWSKIIIPSVFPYLVLSEYIASGNVPKIFTGFPGVIVRKILRLSPHSLKAVLCGMLCGYPSGAICASNLCKEGFITQKEATRLIGFTNNAGPLFLISAIGTSMLGSTADGFAIYIIQLISAFIYGVVSARLCPPLPDIAVKTVHTSADFCDAVRKSVVTTVNICGFMIVSYILSECIMILLYKILPFTKNSIYTRSLCSAFFEISAGMQYLCLFPASPLTFGLICSAVSWSGLSVILQIRSASKNTAKSKDIIIPKLFQAFTSFVIGYIYKIQFAEYAHEVHGVTKHEISVFICLIIFALYILKQYCAKFIF